MMENFPQIVVGVLGATLAALMGAFAKDGYTWLTGRAKDAKQFRYFPPPDKDQFNLPFYRYFSKVFDDAKHSIYVTGTGFECVNQFGREVAQEYHRAIRAALHRNVSVIRIQTRNNISKEWADMLKEFLNDPELSKNFQLFYRPTDRDLDIISYSVVDPESDKASVSEIMISSDIPHPKAPMNVASTGVFMLQNKRAAERIRDTIVKITKLPTTVSIANSKFLDEVLIPRQLYFSYGSNMYAKQITERVPSARRNAIGYIKGYKLVFNRMGTIHKGGVASVVHTGNEKDEVYGVIWQISELELAKLDDIEDRTAYERKTMTVIGAEGEAAFDCQVYIAFPQRGTFLPTPDYKDLIVKGATENNLPATYVEQLRAIQTVFDKNAKGNRSSTV